MCVCVLSGADCARHVADVAGLSAAEVQQSLSSCRSRSVSVCAFLFAMHVCVLLLAGITRGKMYWVSPGSTRQLFAIRRLYTYPAVSLDTQLLPKSL